MSCASGFEVLSLAEAISQEEQRLQNRDKIADIFHSYIERSSYANDITKFIERYGKESVHILFLEELNQQPEQVMGKLWKFLGVDESPNIKLRELILPSNQSQAMLFAKQGVLNKIKTRIKLFLGMYGKDNAQIELDEISEKTKLELRELFFDLNADLSKLLGRKLPF